MSNTIQFHDNFARDFNVQNNYIVNSQYEENDVFKSQTTDWEYVNAVSNTYLEYSYFESNNYLKYPGSFANGFALADRRSTDSGDSNLMQKPIVDNDVLSIGGQFSIAQSAYDIDNPSGILTKDDVVGFVGDQTVTAGFNGKFLSIYIDGTLAATGTKDCFTGSPLFYAELTIDKTAGNVSLEVNGKNVATATLSGSNTYQKAQLGANLMNIFTVTVSNQKEGPLISSVFFPKNSVDSNFSGDISDVDSLKNLTQYRASSTEGDKDTYSYTEGDTPESFFSVDQGVSSIRAVIVQSWVASSGIGTPELNHILDVSGTEHKDSISDRLTSTTPLNAISIFETNPDDDSAWTRAKVQGIKTGYVVEA